MTAALRPSDEAELAQAVADAVAAKAPLEIVGGGTRQAIGRPVQADKTLSTRALSGISLYEPGALTLVVKAGTPISEIEEALAAEDQMLAFEPPDHRSLLGTAGIPTIGGAVAVGASGPRRIQKGACRDFMLGVRFVDGQGQIVKNGGRVMKNVTGYDLVKVMAGQFGTLGVLTEIAFKVLPKPKATAVLLIDGLSDDRAVALMADALGAPFDVSGAAHLPVGLDGRPVTMIRLEGLERSVAYRAEQLRARLSPFGDISVETDPTRTSAGWRWVRDAEMFEGTEGAVWRVSVKPTDGPLLVKALKKREDLSLAGHFYDWGGGLVWLRVADGGDAGAAIIREELSLLGGHATLIRADATTRATTEVFQPEPAPLARISTGLREKFDPHGILNPGRMRA